MSPLRPLAALLLALAALPARAQPAEVEASLPTTRLGLGLGAFAFLQAPGAPERSSVGQLLRVELQRDFGERLAVSLLGLAAAHRMGPSYTGLGDGEARGDFTSLTPALAARVNLLGGGATPQDGRRWWLYARVGGGYTFFWPTALLPRGDLLLFAGLGFEYRTHLRHFALGLEATPAYSPRLSVFSLAITPNVQFAL